MTIAAIPAGGSLPRLRVAIVWALLAGVLIVRGLPQIAAQTFPDPDDILRLVQVRDLLAGQTWFDVTQYRIGGPQGTVMHWSRLVDLPIALILLLLGPIVGQGMAEQVALIAVPLLTLGAIVWATAHVASRWLDRDGITLACLCLGLAPVMMAQVQPLRIDHHAWQIVAAMVALGGLAATSHLRGAITAGAALAVGLSISLEVLPLAAAFGALFALRWLMPGRDSTSMVGFLASLAATLAVVFLATRGPGALTQYCDQISTAHLALFALIAGGAIFVALLRPRSNMAIAGLLTLPVVGGVAIYLLIAPQCAAGPFAPLDPLVRAFWYENVSEGQPAWQLEWRMWVPVVAQALVALAVLVHLRRRAEGAERRFWAEYLIVFVAALLTALLVWRSFAFVGALSAIPLGWLAARLLRAFGTARRAPRKLALAGVLVVALVPGFPVAIADAAAPRPDAEPHTADAAGGTAAVRFAHAASALDALPPARVFAPLDLGPALLLRTRHGVVATAHHRAPAAIHDVIAAFIGSEQAARTLIARHDAEYVIIDPSLAELRLYASEAPEGFAARLLDGRAPTWLEPVELGLPGDVQVWRVERDAR